MKEKKFKRMKRIIAICLAGSLAVGLGSYNAETAKATEISNEILDGREVDLTDFELTGLELDSSTDIFNSTLEPGGSTELNVTGIFEKGLPEVTDEVDLGDVAYEIIHEPSWGGIFKDQAYTDTPIIIEGNVYEKGLGFHSTSMITIQLDGKYDVFKAQAAISDQANLAGDAYFEFFLDKEFSEEENFATENIGGNPILDTTEISDAVSASFSRGGNPRLVDIEVDVSGADTLSIYCNPGSATSDDWGVLVNAVLQVQEETGEYEKIKVDMDTVENADVQYNAETVYSTVTLNKPVATVVNVDENGAVTVAEDGGIAEVTATASYGESGQTVSASKRFINRPFYREYEKTLTMKLFLNDTNYYKDENGNYDAEDICTFEEALEVIRKVDNLTRGIPKIIYLVGWQEGGHDHQWPSWDPALVDEDLRVEGMDGIESLRWLIREARQYNTTVSLHLNLFDVDKESPDFEKYKEADALARDLDGNLLRKVESDGSVSEVCEYMVSYTKAWEAGLFQEKIDYLLEKVPELKEGGTIHIDAFHSYWFNSAQVDGQPTISPWHAKTEGINEQVETDTQRKIFEYCREKGVDVTSEGVSFLRSNAFIGLQPMTWNSLSDLNQMEIPAQLYTGGQGNALRYGDNLHGEDIFLSNMRAGKEATEGFLGRFALSTLQFQYLNEQRRISESGGKVVYTGNITATDNEIIQDGDVIIRQGDNAFTPALWNEEDREIIAYSGSGYTGREWRLPSDWSDVETVSIYSIGTEGSEFLESIPVINGTITLSLQAGEAVSIIADSKEPEKLPADKEKLKELLEQLDNMNLDLSKYTEETVKVYKAALETAQAVMADETLTIDDQAKVDEAVKNLEDARDQLRLKEDSGNGDAGSSADDENKSENGEDGKITVSPKTGDSIPAGFFVLLAVIAFVSMAVIKKRAK